MKISRLMCAGMLALTAMPLSGCAGMAGMFAPAGAPPAAVQHVAQIARGPIDFSLHTFDASLYAFDMAMDLGHPKPGSPDAKRIAGFGRKVLAALTLADAAQKAGAADSYEAAFAQANSAYDSFRELLGVPSTVNAAFMAAAAFNGRPLTPAERTRILDRAMTGGVHV